MNGTTDIEVAVAARATATAVLDMMPDEIRDAAAGAAIGLAAQAALLAEQVAPNEKDDRKNFAMLASAMVMACGMEGDMDAGDALRDYATEPAPHQPID